MKTRRTRKRPIGRRFGDAAEDHTTRANENVRLAVLATKRTIKHVDGGDCGLAFPVLREALAKSAEARAEAYSQDADFMSRTSADDAVDDARHAADRFESRCVRRKF